MTIQYSDAVNNGKLDSIETTIGVAPTLELWNGTKPASCATADTGTKIAEGVLPSDWMAAAASCAKGLSGTWTVTGLSAAGTGTAAQYFRIRKSGVVHMQGSVTVTAGGGDATMDNTSVANTQQASVTVFSIATNAANS